MECHTIRPQIDENWNYLIIAAIKTNDTTKHSKDLSTFRSDFGRVSFQLLFAVVFETLHSSFGVFIENQENLNRTQITHKKGLHYATRDCLLRCCVRWCCTRFQYKLRIRKVTNWKIIYNTRSQPGACGFTMILFHAINAHARLSAGHFILQVHFLYRNLTIVPRHASRLKPYLYAMHNCGHFRTPPAAAVCNRPPLVTLELIACARARTRRCYDDVAHIPDERQASREWARARACTQLHTVVDSFHFYVTTRVDCRCVCACACSAHVACACELCICLYAECN